MMSARDPFSEGMIFVLGDRYDSIDCRCTLKTEFRTFVKCIGLRGALFVLENEIFGISEIGIRMT